MATYGTIGTRIADEINRSDLSSQINNAIQSALLELEGERYWFEDGSATITTVANQTFYALPGDLRDTDFTTALADGVTIREIDGAVCNFNNWFQPLRPVTVDWIDTYQIPTYVGQPYYYAFLGEQIRLAPTPSAAYQITIRGHLSPATLSAASDTNVWTINGEPLLRARAKTILHRDVLRDAEEMQFCLQAEEMARQALNRKTGARQSGRLMAWGY